MEPQPLPGIVSIGDDYGDTGLTVVDVGVAKASSNLVVHGTSTSSGIGSVGDG